MIRPEHLGNARVFVAHESGTQCIFVIQFEDGSAINLDVGGPNNYVNLAAWPQGKTLLVRGHIKGVTP